MIAHVAEAGEGRGRVVLRLGPTADLSDVAVDAALRVAQAFQSEIEGLFVEDSQLFDLAGFDFSREISLSGQRARALSVANMERELHYVSAGLTRKVERAAQAAKVPVRCRVVRDEPMQALAAACAEHGPWNVVTLGAPYAARVLSLRELFGTVWGTTGIVLAGPKAQRTTGPVVALIEDMERVQPMLRAAERLAAATGGEAKLLLVDPEEANFEWMEGQVRLLLGAGAADKLVTPKRTPWGHLPLVELLRRLNAGFVMAQFGGRVAASEDDISRLSDALEGPLFLVR
jgi:hypothetical protein